MNALLPLLNKFIPIGIALKGIEKLNPKVKNFITAATGAGYTTDAALDYLRNKIENPNYVDRQNQLEAGEQQGTLRPDEAASKERIRQQEQVPNAIGTAVRVGAGALGGTLGALGTKSPESTQAAPQPDSPPSGAKAPGGLQTLIAQYPELGSFLDQKILKEKLPIPQAASEARKKKLFQPIISKIEDQVGQSFEDLLTQFFQGEQSQQPQKQPENKMGGISSTQAAIADAIRAHLAKKKGING